ncbi:Major facilitator superfamily domain, general substrate transporter [Akanthomyces lecanii RCEF 1005]|uniref:Major facilitator superfamily domain, general substrate transporter n=1 Tax=Akanthomyces lecanii RCEF 1005 TaxID=1081108 RepID=A0A162KKG5_CORDF|nr:Major facilitator superfamily domain, general substrate transporter [Akanthomyces lecanii RCEF 1005]
MAVSYMFQFLDKSALAYTSILGLNESLHLTGTQFSWSNSIYYFGYLVASYPFGLLMVRFSVGKVIALSVAIWGMILMLTAVCHDHSGLWANRFFLGVSEAAVAPGLTVVISMWYTRSEQPLRQAAWFLGNTFAGIFGGLVSYGIGHIKTIAPWKAVFLFFGAATVSWSVVIFFFLPEDPGKARYLTKEEREKAVKRVKTNMTGSKTTKIDWSQCLEAVCDLQVWLLVLIQLSGQIANGGVQGFGSIVIHGMGFETLKTLQVQMVAYVFQLIFVLIATIGSTFLHNTRTWWIVFDMAFAIAGAAMVGQLDGKWSRFFGYCLTMGYTPNLPIILSMLSANIAGFTKKMTVNAMIFIAYCTGNIIGPQLFLQREYPTYKTGFLAIMICYVIGLIGSLLLRANLVWENRRRDCEQQLMSSGERVVKDVEDHTDKQLTQFRYIY